jgi:hypothetical protein
MGAKEFAMDWITILLVSANVLTLAWALQLLGRQPNRRLRHLVLTVSIVSMTQTAAFLCHLQGQSLMQAVVVVQQCVTSMGTLAAVYLLWVEIRDRRRTDEMLRLAEHESQVRHGRVLREARMAARASDSR